MTNLSGRITLIAIATLAAALVPALAQRVQARQSDYDVCVAPHYDRVLTEAEHTATIAACGRVEDDLSETAEHRAYAYYFRALNHFLEASRLAIAEMKPVGSAGGAARRELDAALDDLAACIKAAPRLRPEPFGLRATILATLEQYDDALADLEQAIRADPDASVPYAQRAVILERLDRFSEARADLDAAIRLDPGNQNAWINRARLWARYGDIDRAYADYGKAEAIGGSQTWYALSGRAKLAVSLGEPQRGFADWTRAAETSQLPMMAAQFHVRAGNLARDYLKDPDKAQQSYARALAVFPRHADALIQHGIALERASWFDEAAENYRKAVDMTRGDPRERVSTTIPSSGSRCCAPGSRARREIRRCRRTSTC